MLESLRRTTPTKAHQRSAAGVPFGRTVGVREEIAEERWMKKVVHANHRYSIFLSTNCTVLRAHQTTSDERDTTMAPYHPEPADDARQ